MWLNHKVWPATQLRDDLTHTIRRPYLSGRIWLLARTRNPCPGARNVSPGTRNQEDPLLPLVPKIQAVSPQYQVTNGTPLGSRLVYFILPLQRSIIIVGFQVEV